MKKSILLTLFICIALLTNAQTKKDEFKVIDPAYALPIGKTTAEFAIWAKSINKWDSNRMANIYAFRDTVKIADGYYDMEGEKILLDRTRLGIRYRYIFKNDTCTRINVSPISIVDFEKEISPNYDFLERKEIDKKLYHIYLHRSKSHKIAFVQIVSNGTIKGGFNHEVLVYPL